MTDDEMRREGEGGSVTTLPPIAIKLRCRRCHRECNPWPLQRSARCAPRDWVMCIAPIEDCEVTR